MSSARTDPRELAPRDAPAARRRATRHSPAWVQSIADDGPLDVTVCIANWNCKAHLRACLESLHDQPQGVRVETVVVDNASTDGAAEMVARDFPEVILIRNRANVGFAVANNQAAARARGRHLFFLNNDTVVPAYALRRLVAFADAHPEVGMIGPRLKAPDGRPQISYRRRPTATALLHRTMLFRWTGLMREAYRRYRRADFDPANQRCVEALMGAAVLLPRPVFVACGRWDEGFPFGGEDIELSVRVGRRHAVVFVPHVEIVHHGRVSSRLNVTYVEPNVAVVYARYLRKTGLARPLLAAYKLAVTCDAPVQWVAKWVQYGWRRLTGRTAKAEKSLLAARAIGHFLTRGLAPFWRA
jgi:N-acetylglucosaminyl-diphospho-decaprenol L-rhamnosyltransferase